MRIDIKIPLKFSLILASLGLTIALFGGGRELPADLFQAKNTRLMVQDTGVLPNTVKEPEKKNPFDLKDPKSVEKSIEYDPATGLYKVTEKIGSDYYKPPTYMSFDEYMKYRSKNEDRDYYKNLAGISTAKRNISGIIDPVSKIDLKRNLADRLFGGLGVEIKPVGNIDFIVGGNYNYTANPAILGQQRPFSPNFDMNIQMDVQGNVGDKLKLNTNYNTQASFDFENRLKLQYDSQKFSEDDIIKKIEAGNVSMPLRSNLIQGSQNLFGFKTEWQFGHLKLTGLVSQQKSKQENVQAQGGGVIQEFEMRPDQYDDNRHFFLNSYFRNTYEENLKNLPEVTSKFKIKNIEVWLTDDAQNSRETDFRDIVAITDLGTPISDVWDFPTPDLFKPTTKKAPKDREQRELYTNQSNDMYNKILRDTSSGVRELSTAVRKLNELGLRQGRDFEKVRARRLSPQDYSFNPDLGFISLRIRPRPNQVLAVSYQYTFAGTQKDLFTDAVFQVGEFSSDVKSDSSNFKVVFTKMLKSSNQSTSSTNYDLMMKNVYSTGGFNLNEDNFVFDIYYQDPDGKQKRFIQELDGFPLLNLFRMDFLNKSKDPQPDGVFDFVSGQTVIPASGNIIFPVLEPFGNSLKFLLSKRIQDPIVIDELVKKYGYPALYDTSKTAAQRNLVNNYFLMKGKYKSGKSNEISLRSINLDPNSKIIVTAGSLPLVEGSDFTVDRNLGKVTILNEAIVQSGVPINVKFENQELFSFQTKTMLGFRAEYSKYKDLHIGATYMHLFEQPFTPKVNIGEDPINNRIFGADFGISKQAPWVTRALDKLPLYSTKEPSRWSLQAEGAVLKPGHSRAINQTGSDGGVVYLDDFEGSSSGIGLYFNTSNWILASRPEGLDSEEAFRGDPNLYDHVYNTSNRALLNWYRIDNFARVNAPDADHTYSRLIQEQELFPNRSVQVGFAPEVSFDMTYYPREKGPYNYDTPDGISANGFKTAGVDPANKLLNPKSRWAGIMTKLNTNDFEQANVEYIDFWLLNPFMDKQNNTPTTSDGKIFFQLGTFSEDIFKDGQQQFENGLPTNNIKILPSKSTFGRISKIPPVINGFDLSDRDRQDVGFDGLNSKFSSFDKDEAVFFSDYINEMSSKLNQEAFTNVLKDPSNDDYISYRDAAYPEGATVLEKYKKFNNPEGNSSQEAGQLQPLIFTQNPDQEDINFDKSLNEQEAYFNYEVPIQMDGKGFLAFDPKDPNNRITETRTVKIKDHPDEIWYRFRIPINDPTNKIGQITDFRSILAMRILFTGFDEQVTFRFVKLQLGRNQWRRYSVGRCDGDIVPDDYPLIIDKVDIEENNTKLPFNYLSPPGIQRERFINTTTSNQFANEASLLLRKENFRGTCEQSIFKIIDLDIRRYKRLKMFTHAESRTQLKKGDVSVFIRLGKDFENNYYEYEIPVRFVSGDSANFNLRDTVWLKENEFDFPLQLLVDLKNERNALNVPFTDIYSKPDPDHPENKVKIIGNPTIGLVRGVQIGMKNNLPVSDPPINYLEVWLNELRLTGIEERGGYAALARGEINLADLGNISMATNYSSLGWGGIDQRLANRAIEEVVQYDATANIELGKFLPKKSGIKIPFSYQISNSTRTPEFDPIDTDVKLKDKINFAQTKEAKDTIRNRAIDYTNIESIAFNNVRKERSGSGKPMPWNIENFGVSYQKSVATKRNPIVENDRTKTEQGSLDYSYSLNPKYIEPFKKIVKSNALKVVSDFNFNLIPNSISVRNNLDRRSSSRTYRFADPKFSTWEDAKFAWNREYSVNWDITRSLKLNFNASNEATIDQITYNPLVGSDVDPISQLAVASGQRKSYLWDRIKNFGRTKHYKHNVSASYQLPTRLIPILDWITARAQYSSNYSWDGGSLTNNNIEKLGSVIGNGQTITLTGEFNFTNFYNKSSYLRQINGEGSGSRPRPSQRKTELNSDENKKDPKAKKEKVKKQREVSLAEKIAIRPMLTLRRVQLNYTQNKSTVVPGYLDYTSILGMNKSFTAPGWAFVAGIQPDVSKNGWLDARAAEGLISADYCQNQEIIQRSTSNVSAKVRLEPFKDFNIDVSLDRAYTNDHTEAFRFGPDIFDPNVNGFQHYSPYNSGQYSISFISLQTFFKQDLTGLFNDFSARRSAISKRVANQYGITDIDPTNPIYHNGFLGDHIDVIIPSFISAYTNTPTEKANLDIFKTLPLPNWSINYNGLTKYKFIKNIFQDFSIRHSYSNKLTVNSFKTNLNYKEDINNVPASRRGDLGNSSYYSKFEIPAVVITENFSPLIGINIKSKKGLELGIDYSKNRLLNLAGQTEGRLNETNGYAFTFKGGYTIKDVYLSFIPGVEKMQKAAIKKLKKKSKDDQEALKAKKPKGNDLQISMDFSIRRDITTISILDYDVNGAQNNGSKQISLTPNILYNINKNLNAKLFFNYRKTIPYQSGSFTTVNASGGLTVQFLLN